MEKIIEYIEKHKLDQKLIYWIVITMLILIILR